MMQSYPAPIEAQMQRYYQSLSEKDRRRYAAIEAIKLGYGGQVYIRRLFGCHHETLALGLSELEDEAGLEQEGIRRSGGGRKSAFETIAGLDEAFLRVLERYTAGSPMDENVKWTNLKRHEIAALLREEGIEVSVTVVDQLLKKHNFRKRKAVKTLATGESEHRNEQFETIARLKETYQAAGNPVMSMDTKKKELIGNLYRNGTLYTQEPVEVFDHDWATLATGVAIPHGLYDMTDNVGYIQLGTSHDTSEFACDSIRYWWNEYGKIRYSLATSILLLCDGGGSNSSRYYIFKQDLQALVNELGIEIRIAHYPPYTSKYNPIEHRLFPHISRVCQGMIFDSIQTVQDLMARATTRTGLNVFTTILDKTYLTGRKVAENFKSTMKIVFDEFLPQWNYTAIPEFQVI